MSTAREIPLIAGLNIVVGFSGGNDSLALALLLARTQSLTGINSLLVHVDHGLRPNSKVQAKQARAIAEKIGLPFENVELKFDLLKRHPGSGMEEAARRERFAALAVHAVRRSTDIIALAHHSRDQAETVLLHLMRGAGVSGMGGMEKQGMIAIPWWEGRQPVTYKLWRPLLDESPDDLAAYVAASGLEPVEDESNQDQTIRRNALRHQILPALESIQPGATKAIARFAEIAAVEDEMILELAIEAFPRIQESRVRYARGALETAPLGMLRRLIQLAAISLGLSPLSLERVEQITMLVRSDPTDRVIQLGADTIAVSDTEWVYIGPAPAVWDELASVQDLFLAPLKWDSSMQLHVGLERRAAKNGVSVHASSSPSAFGKEQGTWYIAIPKRAFEHPVVLRMLRPGDRWAKSRAPMREWLRVDGVPPIARNRVMVVASEQGVWWAPTIERPERDSPAEGEEVIYLDIQ